MSIANFNNQFVSPLMDIFILILSVAIIFLLLYLFVLAVIRLVKGKTKKELTTENAELTRTLERKNVENETLSRRVEHLENLVLEHERMKNRQTEITPLIHIGPLKIQAEQIAYIVSQSFEQVTSGSSRIKIIHYTYSNSTDFVRITFESLVELLPSNFMMVNKNQLVNLHEIRKIQGNELYLQNVDEPFLISDTRREEFDIRIASL